jgi:CBS domain-containing protein
MTSRRVGSVMVVEGGQLVGIFTERDALVRVLAAGLDPETATLDQIMTADPTVIPVTASLSQALHVMHDGGFRHLPVVEGGKPVGMVSLRDAAGGEILAFERQLKDKAALEGILG